MRRTTLRTLAVAAALALTAPAAPATAADVDSGTFLGVFRENARYVDTADGFAADVGATPASVQWFEAWSNRRAFPVQQAADLWARGILPHWTWEPWDPTLPLDDPAQIDLRDIVSGEWDAYVSARGAELARLGTPVLVRWGHEFNGDWYPWAVSRNGRDPDLYVRAYRRVHDLVTAAGATNVQWVWTYNASSSPAASWNAPELAYPGDDYVDWVGIDGYNWGRGPSWDPTGDHWTSFDGVVGDAYRTAERLWPDKPVTVAETASSEDGGDKAAWIRTMLADVAAGRYPHLRLLTWFDELKEEAWAVTSSPAAQAAFAQGVADPWFAGDGRTLARVAGGTGPTAEPTPDPTPTAEPTPTPPSGACTATLTVVSAWPGGFQAAVAVRAGAAALSAWTTSFSLPGVTVQSGWSGTFGTSGGTTTVANAPWNGSLPAGGTTEYGFVAAGPAPTDPVAVTCG